VLRVLAGVLVVILALFAAALVAGVIEGGGIPRCDDREAMLASDADECFEASGTEKAIGLVLVAAAALVAARGAFAGVGYVRRRQGGATLLWCALLSPVLAFASIFLLRISF
jgi:hypothetical protein